MQLTDGYIYVLQSPNYPKLVKIGRTRRPIPERIDELAKCRDLDTLTVVDTRCYDQIHNVARLESLIHDDLANERRCFHCPCKNGTQHGEWFEMDAQEAADRVERWRDWIRQEPYRINGELKENFRRRVWYCENHLDDLEKENRDDQRWKAFMTPFFMDD